MDRLLVTRFTRTALTDAYSGMSRVEQDNRRLKRELDLAEAAASIALTAIAQLHEDFHGASAEPSSGARKLANVAVPSRGRAISKTPKPLSRVWGLAPSRQVKQLQDRGDHLLLGNNQYRRVG